MVKGTGKAKTTVKKKAATAKVRPVDPFETVAAEVTPAAPKAKKAVAAKPKRRVKAKPSTAKVAAVEAATTVAAKPEKAAAKPKTRKTTKKTAADVTAEIAAAQPEVELSPTFKALAEPKLPELQRENRARLLMQSPTEIYFYWSIRKDPYHILRDAFGETGSYTLVLKLTDIRRGTEEIHRVEPEGNWWFAVEPDGEYRAEIGFYAPNRPYFRIVYSNTVETPRRSPSPHPATESEWRVTARKFAEVLDVAGFAQDAFDVAMAGDDSVAAQDATHAAFTRFIGLSNEQVNMIAAEDLRYTMVALAAGLKLEELRWRVGPAMFAILQANADKLEAGKAKSALTEHFNIDESEFVEEQYGPAVHGASLINFPRTLKPRKLASQYRPLSSHSLR